MGAEGKPVFDSKRKRKSESSSEISKKMKAARQKNMKDLREFNKMADEAGLSYGQMVAKMMMEKKESRPAKTFVGEVRTIKDVCQKHQVTQTELCNMYDIPIPTMSNWYLGKHKPSDYIVRILDEALEARKSS